MESNRRDFLKGTAWMAAAAVAAGCSTDKVVSGGAGSMATFAAEPLKKVRVGVVGLGMRGNPAVHRLSMIPGVEVVALCEVDQSRVDKLQAWLAENKRPRAVEYVGPEAYMDMCQADIDLVYNTTPWQLHVPVARCALRNGKHVATEVPAAFTIDECWELVELSESTRRHCMMLENCCYGETELLALNLCRLGMLGELVHGEAAYIHDLRSLCYRKPAEGGYWNYWRLRWNETHKGNHYPTHGLGPICQYMDINRGDRMDYLVSLESNQFNFESYAKNLFPADSWQANLKVEMGDMNTTLIKTVKGRSIMVQHDVSSPRPYSRINLISGTKGILRDYPNRLVFTKKPGGAAHSFFNEGDAKKMREEYMHPLWKTAGKIAQKIGGHGGMDFLMDLRLCYCLQNGLPLDENVYDLATWCSLCELSEKSVRNRSRSMDVPDFTRGAWETTAPLGIVDIDLVKMGLQSEDVKKDNAALNV